MPSTWGLPLYLLGQFIKQGQIIGVNYYPPGTPAAKEYEEEGWSYLVMPSMDSDILLHLSESEIKSCLPDQACAFLQTEIDKHQSKVAAL